LILSNDALLGLVNEALTCRHHPLALVHELVSHAHALLDSLLGGLDWYTSLVLKVLTCDLDAFETGVESLLVVSIDE